MEQSQIMDEIIHLERINLVYTIPGKILSFLKANKDQKEPIYSKHIQDAFNIEKSTASQHLTTLERLNLIKRERHGMFKAISITELGESFIP